MGHADIRILARYDRAEDRWTLLPTLVDKNAMTLTTSTNRFSIWVVMAAEKVPSAAQTAAGSSIQSPGPEPLLICGLIAPVLLVRSARELKKNL